MEVVYKLEGWWFNPQFHLTKYRNIMIMLKHIQHHQITFSM